MASSRCAFRRVFPTLALPRLVLVVGTLLAVINLAGEAGAPGPAR